MVYLKGMPRVLTILQREIKEIENKSLAGLIRAGILIRRDMEDTPPKIPVDTGNLRASWFIVTSKGTILEGKRPKFRGRNAGVMASEHSSGVSEYQREAQAKGTPLLIMGFTANYAVFVHEMVGAKFSHPGRRAGAGAKFFESALKRNSGKILELVGREAKIR